MPAKNRILLRNPSALCCIATLLLNASVTMANFSVGFGDRDITPEVIDTWEDIDGDAQFDPEIDVWEDVNGNGRFDAVWMAGFQNSRPARGVLLPLKAVAIVVDDGKHRIGVVAADTIGLMRSFVRDLREHVPPNLGLDYVMVHATHNHEGPDTQGLWGESLFSSGVNQDYMKYLRDQMIGALEDAAARLEPASLHMAAIPNSPNTPIRDARKPEVIDDEIRVLLFKGVHGRVLGTIVNVGIHVELAWDHNLLLTSDVAGYLRNGISGGIEYEGNVLRDGIGGTTLWLTGNIGGLMTSAPGESVYDIFLDKRFTEGSHAKARAFGYGIADTVLSAWQTDNFFVGSAPQLQIVTRKIELGITNWRLALATLAGIVESDSSLHFYPPFVRYESELVWIKIGDATLTGIPGELYPEIAVGGIENPEGADFEVDPVEVPPIRDVLSGKVNLMVNLANDAIGYIIPKSEWDDESPWLYGSPEETYGEVVSLGEETGPIIHREIIDLLRGGIDGLPEEEKTNP